MNEFAYELGERMLLDRKSDKENSTTHEAPIVYRVIGRAQFGEGNEYLVVDERVADTSEARNRAAWVPQKSLRPA